jgi:putative transcriptional regulator
MWKILSGTLTKQSPLRRKLAKTFNCRWIASSLYCVTGVLLWCFPSETGRDWTPKPIRIYTQSSQSHTVQPAKGCFLVAVRNLRDPNFSKTVVLLTKFGQEGAMGLIVNRPTDIKLASLLSLEGVEKRSETIFIGGPVERSTILLLVRSKSSPAKSERIADDIYLSSSGALLRQYIAGSEGEESFRLYSGYSSWVPGQLEYEIEHGSWHIFQSDPDAVFSARPSKVWQQWIKRTDIRFAQSKFSIPVKHQIATEHQFIE